MGLAVASTAGPLSERLLVVAQSGVLTKIFLVRLDGRDWQRLTDSAGSEADAVYSAPRHEVFYRAFIAGDWELNAWNIARRERRQLTSAAGLDHEPQPSPDGKWLVYTTQRFGPDQIMLQSLDDPSAEPRRLTWDDGHNSSPSWSPDGKMLVFASRRNGQSDLYSLDPNSEEQVRLTRTDEDEVKPRWSPDGNKVMFQTVTGRSRRGVLGWLEMPSLKRVELAEVPGSLHEANWSPDGQAIVSVNYAAPAPQLTTLAVADPQAAPFSIFRREAQHIYWTFRQASWASADPSSWPDNTR
jgi:Tol biopolymer transport system component